MPDPKRLINTIKRATQLFRSTPGRNGMIVELNQSAEDVLIAGDLHGNLAHFQCLLDRARLDRNPRRHLVLQELIHGDSKYPNGGCKSHQLVDLVAALKSQYPDRVHFILGNHELSEILARPIIKGGVRTGDLFRHGIDIAYGTHSGEIFAAYIELFDSLPLAVTTANRVFMSHSYPESEDMNRDFNVSILRSKSVGEICKSDERSLHDLLWGRDGEEITARRFASLVQADLLVTGHMPCPQGFRTPNSLQLILDCSRFPACYCLFSNQHPLALSDLRAGVRTLG
jgi:Calcineurin-like phosphoesterase